MLNKIFRQLIEELTGGLKHDVEAYLERILRRAVKTLLLGSLGVAFLIAGSIFVLIGMVAYLSAFMFSGLAWGLVGVVVALVGGVLVLLVRR
jgi:hypothetical protein